MAKKNNQKSIRVSDEILAFVEKQKGNGFNQKFENTVIKFTKEEKELNIRLAEKKNQYDELSKKVSALQKVIWSLQNIEQAKEHFEMVIARNLPGNE